MAKRIMKKLILKANEDVLDIFNMQEHESYQILLKIFSTSKTQINEPICSMIDDIFDEE
jgi:hypothetical protein